MINNGTTLESYQQFLRAHYLGGSGGERGREEQPAGPPPRTGYAAGLWKGADLYAALLQAGEVVTLGPSGMTEMRTVSGRGAPQRPISLGTQVVMPGERTRAHRNMKNESFLVWQAPPGAAFVMEYEAFPMERGDLVVCPTGGYHDHWNAGSEPAFFINGLDRGYSGLGEEQALNDRFPDDEPYQEVKKPADYGLMTLGHVRRTSDATVHPRPPVRYPWAATRAAITALRNDDVEGDPFDGLHLTFSNPVDGGPTLPTFAWHVQLLTARQQTRAHRHNSTAYYHVFEGEGATIVEGERREWGPGDLFIVPPWTWHWHENALADDAILFSIDDWPAMTKLGFYRKDESFE